MPMRLVGLFGCGAGPRVSTSKFTAPLVRISGLAPAGRVVVTTEEGEKHEFCGDGEFPIAPTAAMRFESFEASSALACFVVGS